MKESRMDRIERGMEEFFRGMAELRESQKKTDEQFIKLREERKEAWKKRDASFAQEMIAIAEERASIAEERASIAELRASIAELRESQKKTDEQLRRTEKKVEDTSTTLGNLGVIDGKVAEDLFYRNVRHVFAVKNFAFSSVRRNVKRKGVSGEYDIVAVGDDRVLVVEVKKKMEQHMIDDFLDRKIPKFRQIFPEYRDFSVIGGIGSLVMQDAISRYAEKKGLYVLTQNGEGGAMLVNRQNFRAKEF